MHSTRQNSLKIIQIKTHNLIEYSMTFDINKMYQFLSFYKHNAMYFAPTDYKVDSHGNTTIIHE